MYKMHRTKRVIQTKYVLSETEYALVLKDRETIKTLTGVAPGEVIVLEDYLKDLEKKVDQREKTNLYVQQLEKQVSVLPFARRIVNLYREFQKTSSVIPGESIKQEIFEELQNLHAAFAHIEKEGL